MFLNLKQIASEALRRSIARDGNATQLESKDLLAVIQDRGDIYKFAIARKLILNKNRSGVNDNPNIGKVAKNMKPADYDDEGEFSDSNVGIK